MAGVAHAFGAEERADRLGRLDARDLAVRRAEQLAPLLDAVVAHQLHAHHEVAAHELRQLVVERLALVLRVELLAVPQRHPRHLDVRDHEARLLDRAHDLPDVLVAVRLDHRERPAHIRLLFLLYFEPLPGEHVGIVDHFELPRVDA